MDDFVILHMEKNILKDYKNEINIFLKKNLAVELHPDKSKIICLGRKLNFLGFRIFYHHKLLKWSNLRKMRRNFECLIDKYQNSEIDYDVVYDFFEGWFAYAIHANTHFLRKSVAMQIESNFLNEISTKEFNKLNP